MMAGKTISTNLRLRLKGWKKAAQSRKTPEVLRKAIRRNIRELRARLRRGRLKKFGSARSVREPSR
jgi:hypothetical protein